MEDQQIDLLLTRQHRHRDTASFHDVSLVDEAVLLIALTTIVFAWYSNAVLCLTSRYAEY